MNTGATRARERIRQQTSPLGARVLCSGLMGKSQGCGW